MKDSIQKLWQLVYRAFEQNTSHGLEVGLAMSQDKNELQHRMLHAISTLKLAGSAERPNLCNQIHADAMLCAANGWLSDDIATEVGRLLNEIQDARD